MKLWSPTLKGAEQELLREMAARGTLLRRAPFVFRQRSSLRCLFPRPAIRAAFVGFRSRLQSGCPSRRAGSLGIPARLWDEETRKPNGPRKTMTVECGGRALRPGFHILDRCPNPPRVRCALRLHPERMQGSREQPRALSLAPEL